MRRLFVAAAVAVVTVQTASAGGLRDIDAAFDALAEDRPQVAVTLLTRALGDARLPRLERADALRYRGDGYLALGQYAEAEADYDASIGLAPSASAMSGKSETLVSRGRYLDALDTLTAAIALDPRNAEPYVRRAWVYNQLQASNLAKADLDKVISLGPSEKVIGEFLLIRVLIQLEMGEIDGAARDIAGAEHFLDDEASLFVVRSMLENAMGDDAAALANAERAADRAPKNVEVRVQLAKMRWNAGQEAAAEADLKAALALAKDAHFRSAQAALTYTEWGRYPDALPHAEAAMKDALATDRMVRGMINLGSANWTTAAEDLADAVASPDMAELPRPKRLYYMLAAARMRTGDTSPVDFSAGWGEVADSGWQDALEGALAGRMTPQQGWNQAVASAPASWRGLRVRCEAGYYLAEAALAQSQANLAKALLLESASACPTYAPEFGLARAELRRMGIEPPTAADRQRLIREAA